MSRPDEVVRLAVASSQIEAQIWRDALEQEGIRPLVRSRSPLSTMGGGDLFETFEVLVLARDEKRARWIIGEMAEPLPLEHSYEEQQETAPAE
jgi:hypothetical protein